MRQYAGYTVVDSAVSLGTSIDSAHLELQRSYEPLTVSCVVCGQPPDYRLVPKKAELDTALSHDKGFVCKHCIQLLKHSISPLDYALKELNPTIGGKPNV